MKKLFLLILILLACGAAYLLFLLPDTIRKQVETALHDAGFESATIGKILTNTDGLTIRDITLDKDGFNTINTVKLTVDWPTFIARNHINSVTIDTFKISSVSDNWKSLPSFINTVSLVQLGKIETEKLSVQNFVWDLSTNQGAIRFEGNLTVQPQDNSAAAVKNIQAVLTAKQHQATLESDWVGTLDQNSNLQLDGTVNDLKVNYHPLQISRGAGWLSLKIGPEGKHIAGQLDAGSGALFDIPIKNVSLLIGQTEDTYPILFRADAAGIDDVHLTMDTNLSAVPEKTTFNASLDIKKISDLLTYLSAEKIKTITARPVYESMGVIKANITYMPARRFPDGPVPFDILVTEKGNEALKGTFLIYPESLDVRGTAQTQPDMISLLKPLLSIKEENITDNTIRLDGNLSSSLQQQAK